jgi:hypothetical protein
MVFFAPIMLTYLELDQLGLVRMSGGRGSHSNGGLKEVMLFDRTDAL